MTNKMSYTFKLFNEKYISRQDMSSSIDKTCQSSVHGQDLSKLSSWTRHVKVKFIDKACQRL